MGELLSIFSPIIWAINVDLLMQQKILGEYFWAFFLWLIFVKDDYKLKF